MFLHLNNVLLLSIITPFKIIKDVESFTSCQNLRSIKQQETVLHAFNDNNPFNNQNNNPFNNNNQLDNQNNNPFDPNNSNQFNDNQFTTNNDQFNNNEMYNSPSNTFNEYDTTYDMYTEDTNNQPKKENKFLKNLKKLPSDIPASSSILLQTLLFNGTTEELVNNITYYCDAIEKKRIAGDEKGPLTLFAMKYSRISLLKKLLASDYVAYVETATFFNNRIPRNELPNVQDIPYLELDPYMSIYGSMYNENGEEEYEIIPDCSLPQMSFVDNIIDYAILYLYRKLIEKNSEYAAISDEKGIQGLLEQSRTYMISGATEEQQHTMVQNSLRDLLSPIIPLYRFFIAGIFPSLPKFINDYIVDDFDKTDDTPYDLKSDFDKNRYNFFNFGREDKGREGFDEKDMEVENQFGPLFYAPLLTSFVTPPFFKFFVGPSRRNSRKDGKAGGILVEKCRFLQESNCKGLCLHQCKIPAQKFFKEDLGMDLTVSPNFVTQECQWSFGEKPLPPEDDPSFPKGCLTGCPSRGYEMALMQEDEEGAMMEEIYGESTTMEEEYGESTMEEEYGESTMMMEGDYEEQY